MILLDHLGRPVIVAGGFLWLDGVRPTGGALTLNGTTLTLNGAALTIA